MNDSRAFVAAELLRATVHDAAHEYLSAIERARMHFHEHFACFGLRHRHFALLEPCFVILRDYPIRFHGSSDFPERNNDTMRHVYIPRSAFRSRDAAAPVNQSNSHAPCFFAQALSRGTVTTEKG